MQTEYPARQDPRSVLKKKEELRAFIIRSAFSAPGPVQGGYEPDARQGQTPGSLGTSGGLAVRVPRRAARGLSAGLLYAQALTQAGKFKGLHPHPSTTGIESLPRASAYLTSVTVFYVFTLFLTQERPTFELLRQNSRSRAPTLLSYQHPALPRLSFTSRPPSLLCPRRLT